MSTSMGPDRHHNDRHHNDRHHHDRARDGRAQGLSRQAEAGRREDPDLVMQREKDRYGGVKVGSAFFGWLTATGTAVLLFALVAAVGAAVGLSTDTDPGRVASQAVQDPMALGIGGGIAMLVVVLLAYFCGGYVAGRMARFNGARQGVAVWLWAVLIALVVALLGVLVGDQFDVLGQASALPPIPVSAQNLNIAGITAAVAAAAVSLLGAVLGGLAGMRFHRKVDEVGRGLG